MNLECRVTQIIPLGSHDMFLAEIVNVTVDEKYMDETGRFHLNEAGLVSYSHGEYFKLGKKLGKFGYSVQKKKSGKKAGEKRGSQPEKQKAPLKNRANGGTARKDRGKAGSDRRDRK